MKNPTNNLTHFQQQQLFLCVRDPGGIPDSYSQRSVPQPSSDHCEHYQFDWGFILQRRVQHFLILDYCFDRFHQQIKCKISLDRLQKHIFQMLSHRIRLNNDLYGLLRGDYPWSFVCSAYGAFSLMIHCRYENQARQWSVDQLVLQTLPEILFAYQDNQHEND
jgi:hypothetical protein